MFLKTSTFLILSTFLLSATIAGQDLTGIWKGYFITKDLSQYKVEFQLKQTGSSITGVSYSYLTTVYYGKATMSGRCEEEGQSLNIQEFKTVEIKTSEGSVNCLMNYKLGYSKSGREEYLEGSFSSKYEYNSEGIKKGEDCGGGKVYLRRVSSSDFYPEPFLQKTATKKIIVNEAPLARKTQTNSTGTDSKLTTAKTESAILSTSKNDTATFQKSTNNAAQKTQFVPPVNNNRFNDLIQVITVKNQLIQVFLYDNGEIDGDTITVFLNNKLALSKRRLSTTPLTLTLEMDDQNEIQELTMVAENLGKIPPNTALMIVESGSQRFRVQLTSTEQKNAVVRFRYE